MFQSVHTGSEWTVHGATHPLELLPWNCRGSLKAHRGTVATICLLIIQFKVVIGNRVITAEATTGPS